MKRVLTTCLLFFALSPLLAETAMLNIQTQNQENIQVPIATIRSITYDKTNGTKMYITAIDSTQTYLLSDILRMSFSNVPQPMAIPNVTIEKANNAQKVLINGTIYLIHNNRVFTLKGERIK